MKHLLGILSAVAILGAPLVAHAAPDPEGYDGSSGSFTDTNIVSGASFADSYDFVTAGGVFNVTVDTASPGFDFTKVLLNGVALSTVVPDIFYSALDVPVSAGTQVVTVDGSYAGPATGSYSGDVHFTPTVSAAPEPASWLLMFAGLGGIGLMMRRARDRMGVRIKDVFAG